MCIAFSQVLRDDYTDADYDWVVVQLRKNWKAKVVVYFVEGMHGRGVFMAMERANAETEFITLSSDGLIPLAIIPSTTHAAKN